MPFLGTIQTLQPISRPKVVLRFAKHLWAFESGRRLFWQYPCLKNIVGLWLFDSSQFHVAVSTPNIMSQTQFFNFLCLYASSPQADWYPLSMDGQPSRGDLQQ